MTDPSEFDRHVRAWDQAVTFMEEWNGGSRERPARNGNARVGGPTLYEMTMRLARFLVVGSTDE